MSKPDLQTWVKNLRNKNMPVLGAVIAELNQITDSEESDASQLAEVILRDPNLTSHVLRVANSVKYNYSSQKINTISRAIVLIGLKGMRAICISLLILDRLLGDQPKERVIALVAQGFHAATQAQNVLQSSDANEAEEVFIAALLFNLGEMAFWMSESVNTNNADLLAEDPKRRKQAMESIIGGSFKALTRELAKHWKLGETLQEALFPAREPSAKVRAVIAGDRISRAALFGWESPQFNKVLKEVASLRGVSLDEALEEIKQSADKASVVAVSYGAADACPLIPSSLKAGYFGEKKPKSKISKADPQLQLSILRELSSATTEHADVNTIFQMVLEGMHRGIGLERVAIAFINGHKVSSKYMLGENTEHWRTSFKFDIGPYTDNIFTYASQHQEAVWLTEEFMGQHPEHYPEDIVRIIGKLPALVSVVRVGDRNAAFFYADRWTYGGILEAEQFESFKHFSSQAQFCLSLLSNASKSGHY